MGVPSVQGEDGEEMIASLALGDRVRELERKLAEALVAKQSDKEGR